METRTSASHPIGVDWARGPASHRIGLTFAPGKKDRSTIGNYRWDRDLAADLDRLVQTHGATVLACLVEDHELPTLGIPDLVGEAQRRGLDVRRVPIVDGGTPRDLSAFQAFTTGLADAVRAGETVVVHCRGGLGRTGMVAACTLIELGLTPEQALEAVKGARGPKCPETAAQRAVVQTYRPRAATTPAGGRADRIAGAVLGAAIGDAMGHPTEFITTVAEIRRKYGPQGVTKFELFRAIDGRRFAPYTDDTQMAEAVLACLLDNPRATLDATMTDLAQRFVDWADNPQGGHRGPGNACLAGCSALKAGATWSEAGGAKAGGCGSVMRAYPFGLVFADDLTKAEAWAVAHSKLTHRDPIALAACAAMAVATARALAGDTPAAVVEAAIAAAGRHDPGTAAMMAQARDEAVGGVGPEVTLDRLQAWAAHEAIAAGVYIFLRHPDDARAAILEGTNTRGDSDTIATIAGALVGARVGVAGLPPDWVAEVERSEELLALAARVGGVAAAPPAAAARPTATAKTPSNRAPGARPGGPRLDRLLVIDLESTCWEHGDREAGEKEPIEIGVTVLERATLARVEKRSILVKPARSKVSAFCTKLTTLTQAQVDGGVSLAEACDILVREYDGPSLTWVSFGDYDRTMLEKTCAARGVKSPLGKTHINVKNLFAVMRGLDHEVELKEALAMIGQPLVGTHHRGDDDAWNIAAVLASILSGAARG